MADDIMEIAYALSPLEQEILPFLTDSQTLDELIKKSGFSDAKVKRALMWLDNRGIIEMKTTSEDIVVLGKNGELACVHGLPEMRILGEILTKPKTISQLETNTLPKGEIMSSIGVLKRLQAIRLDKKDGELQLHITPAGKAICEKDTYEDAQLFAQHKKFPLAFNSLTSTQKDIVARLQKRKDMLKKEKQKTTTITLTKTGRKLSRAKIDFSQVHEQLTSQMLQNGTYKDARFRVYDVQSPVPHIAGGRRHPLREALNLIRDVYVSMGFQEMSGPWVESAFWCMDSMWIPQDHPARDEQDTFFVGDNPQSLWKAQLPDKDLVNKVKESHENGLDTGSTGHTKSWNEQEAKKVVLRTHSTATSFRMFGERGIGHKDGKYFYISNNFRNEAVDATHLAEFLQVEGFIVGDDLTLADLMGVIKEFYARFGIHKIRFKPTFNPYTQPSMEAHYYDEQKGKWYALINSGIFRPEALAPYGIKKTVIAWGMGASRVAALLNHKHNLRELVGPTVDLDWIAKHVTPQPDLED